MEYRQGGSGNYILITVMALLLAMVGSFIVAGPLIAGLFISVRRRMLEGRTDLGDLFSGFNLFHRCLPDFHPPIHIHAYRIGLPDIAGAGGYNALPVFVRLPGGSQAQLLGCDGGKPEAGAPGPAGMDAFRDPADTAESAGFDAGGYRCADHDTSHCRRDRRGLSRMLSVSPTGPPNPKAP